MTETVSEQTTIAGTLPDSWEWSSVEQLGDVVTGNTPSTKERENYGGSIPFFKPTDLNAGYRVSDSDTTLTEVGAQKSRLLPAKSILVTCIGATIGKTGLSHVEGATNQQINALVPSKEQITPEYIYFAFVSHLLQDQILNHASSTTLPILNKSKFSRLKIPLPPLNEQHRIVEKIEELFTKLDAGVRSLNQTQALLKNYRRSVLKAAVEGELSREWRETHRDELEPASEFLDRILQERREKFTGKKYKEPASPDTSNLPALPDCWEWATVDQASEEVRYGSSAKTNEDSIGVPVLRMGNIKNGQLVADSLKYLPTEHKEFPELLLKPGDLLFNRTNSFELVGKTGVYTGTLDPCSFASYLIRVRFLSGVLSEFVAYFINSAYGREWISSVVSQQVGQANVNGSKLKALSMPLPPPAEQRLIVEEVERRLSVVDKLEATVEANLKQANGLRQSILERAFRGELVAQDPDDEPASVLLERIRSERQAAKPKLRRKARRVGDNEAQGRLI